MPPADPALPARPWRLNVLGCGRVGRTLARLAQPSTGVALQDLWSRRLESAQGAQREAGQGRAVANATDLRPAELWLLAVPDGALADVAHTLATHWPDHDQAAPVVFHASGFHPARLLQPLAERGACLASLHPVRSFADTALAASAFAGTLCGLEGDALACARLRVWLQALGAQPFDVDSAHKGLYHAAAVLANNGTVVLQALADEAWAAAGVAAPVRAQLMQSLLHATVENVLRLGPAGAITGPAARGDSAVVQAQSQQVGQWHPQAQAVYDALAPLARRLALQGHTQAPGATPGKVSR